MLVKEAYTQLRTKEQLGYIVSSEVHSRWGVLGIRIVIQSLKPPHELEQRIESFLQSFHSYLQEMEEETFREHVDSLRTKKLEPDITLEQRSSRLFHEICMREECWDRRRQEAAHLKDVTKKEIVELFRDHLAPGGKNRRMLSSQVVGQDAISKQAHPGIASKEHVTRYK
ncbi:hypothetical protein GUITHDRAFT_109554 [Guillardia theta CCMP2712]|uniref:Coenzyme PQQ synthesis protein F-like C-terminal lobe domain-containing protein n=1 Tax=Guillardia theta (strain CCMP2712) TaxID=905079 RepID=L1J7B8_GUITC|nr:hypothetical protein GUITHDRAFT_109554 [Guillardia theta CCMP2712]EKX44433.1 hypothetical protein GUITHDRAFT_109554 [Guillardia theta CCMP2712]|eukprot:XP_005831413.1 hypothetical protein GUITHDRAFT_109554 [Guillardia theta CCMP2712]